VVSAAKPPHRARRAALPDATWTAVSERKNPNSAHDTNFQNIQLSLQYKNIPNGICFGHNAE
jgi:hypothetical protein